MFYALCFVLSAPTAVRHVPSLHVRLIFGRCQVVMHQTSRSPCMLAHLLYNADVLVTPHGFQSMLLLFLPRPALLFEIFPYRYYKRGYGPFGNEYGTVVANSNVDFTVVDSNCYKKKDRCCFWILFTWLVLSARPHDVWKPQMCCSNYLLPLCSAWFT